MERENGSSSLSLASWQRNCLPLGSFWLICTFLGIHGQLGLQRWRGSECDLGNCTAQLLVSSAVVAAKAIQSRISLYSVGSHIGVAYVAGQVDFPPLSDYAAPFCCQHRGDEHVRVDRIGLPWRRLRSQVAGFVQQARIAIATFCSWLAS